MPDFRAFWTPASADPAEIVLDEAESRHLVTVNRAAPEDPVTVFDGRGTEWTCTLRTADRRAARLVVRSARKAPPLPYLITLGQALPKGSGMDAIVRKATELGAARIAPLKSERSQVHLAEDRSDRKIEKWRTAAIEAAKQCGNPWLPEIAPVQDVAGFVASARHDLKLIASLEADAQPLHEVLAAFRAGRPVGSPPPAVAWLIGPEGDFTPAELGMGKTSGFIPVTLGPLVLRCETAATYALSVLAFELGW
jgi:16S rRNA (uracil1498-N3)-methyltransferase